MRDDVVALYVDPRGPYPGLVKEWYDEKRDARTYAGPLPVVAHPPCGPWSSLRHLSYEDTLDLAPRAIEQVRTYGGVFEHPSTSLVWGAPLPKPGRGDRWGITIELDQCDWGHVARKPTRLYLVNVRAAVTYPLPKEPTHWCSGGRTKRPGMGATVPPGIKVCSAQQRRRTPVAFAEWLLELAASAGRRAA